MTPFERAVMQVRVIWFTIGLIVGIVICEVIRVSDKQLPPPPAEEPAVYETM
jgi:hypothetical protein